MMPFIDKPAGRKLIKLREAEAISPEGMAHEIHRRAIAESWPRGTIDAYTIRRAERGLVPSLRCRFVIAMYFGVDRDEIWEQDSWVRVESDREAVDRGRGERRAGAVADPRREVLAA